MFLNEKFDFSIFNSKTTIINEQRHSNADFLIKEILHHYKDAQIISFYNTKDYYKETENVQSYIEIKNITQGQIQIVDDYYTARRLGYKFSGETLFYIFRSDSFEESDLYTASYFIDVKPLESGVCKDIDGTIKVYNREETVYESKYKVSKNHTIYFDN